MTRADDRNFWECALAAYTNWVDYSCNLSFWFRSKEINGIVKQILRFPPKGILAAVFLRRKTQKMLTRPFIFNDINPKLRC